MSAIGPKVAFQAARFISPGPSAKSIDSSLADWEDRARVHLSSCGIRIGPQGGTYVELLALRNDIAFYAMVLQYGIIVKK